jgi:CMP-N-acetylneuraminic acid synthetase|tara:strand:- start:409 stop:1050 length:642 start_codon:yes stop_codon:yes gene_type:complete
VKIVIPARRGSKGVPFKNRILLEHTLNIIPDSLKGDVIISTDDDFIIEKAKEYKVKAVRRSDKLSSDEASVKDVLINLIKNENISCQQTIIMLYLTYPERTWEEVESILSFFNDNDAKSVLCKKEVKTHPHMCMFEAADGLRGEQVVRHNLYRRQDYPKCFEISHYMCAIKASEVNNLNKNLYNEDTFFYQIEDKIDIDYKKDLEAYNDKNNS